MDKTYKFKITTNLTKINEVILKPIIDNKLSNLIREMALEYYTPDLEYGDVDLLLQALNLNCMSSGYKYMNEAIIYCYYKPDQLEFLNTIIDYISYQHSITRIKVRDPINSKNHSHISL